MSGAIGEESAVEVMKAGVEDFVMKSRLERLLPAVKRSMREFYGRQREARSKEIAEEAVRAREQMLAIVSHDIRNPLSSIQLNAQLLHRMAVSPAPDLDLGREVRAQTERILKAADRLKTLINDLLDQSAIEAGCFSVQKSDQNPVPVILEVMEIFQPLAAQKSISLQAHLSGNESRLPMDREKVIQVLSNLIGNAVKFSEPGGQIDVELHQSLKGNSPAEMVFSVQDKGPGLDPERAQKIFERFAKGKNSSGTGLGLFIAKGIVEAHEGRIGVESVQGQGARFWFSLPMSEGTSALGPALIRAHAAPLSSELASGSILLVEDDDDLREVLQSALEGEGMKVFPYSRADRALDDLKSKKIVPNLMVIDYRMPHMNGAEFIRRHRELSGHEEVPLILMTAEREISAISKELSVDLFIRKPPDLGYFLDTVRRTLKL